MSKIKIISGLTEVQQRILVQRLIEGETQQQVADSVGLKRAQVKRMNDQLRVIMEQEQAEQETQEVAVCYDSRLVSRVCHIVSEMTYTPLSDITLCDTAISLGADSLDLVEIIMVIEEEFDVEIPDKDAENFGSVESIVAYLSGEVIKEPELRVDATEPDADEVIVEEKEEPVQLDPELNLPEEIEEVVEEQPVSNNESSFTMVPNSIINIAHGDDVFTADFTHPRFNEIVQAAVAGNFDEAVKLIDVAKAVEEYSEGDIIIKGEQVLWKGMEVKDGLALRIVELMKEGNEGFKKYVAFMSRLRANPSNRSVTELFGFIGHADIEIDDEGFLIGWKRVQDNYTDCRTGNVKNYVGNIVRMERGLVNEDSNVTCSDGLHVAAWSYLREFHGNVILKVRVDPADVVSIPTDYQDSKMRAAGYEVLGVVDWDKAPRTARYTGNQVVTCGQNGFIISEEDRHDSTVNS